MSRRERAILVGPAYLTEREAEALTLLAQGKTTKEIAEDMGNKWTTVNESLKGKSMEDGMSQDGLTAAGGTPHEFAELLRVDTERWSALAKKRSIHAD